MVRLGAIVAVVDGHRVLLTRRRDFEVWCLPGGHVDAGEALAEAAVREAYEETGLEVVLTRLVGVYSKSALFSGTMHLVLFTAQPVGGTLRPQPEEVVEAAYFERDALPELLLWSHREQIHDALDGVCGIARSNLVANPLAATFSYQTLDAAQATSNMTRADFYLRHIAPPLTEQMGIDVGPGAVNQSPVDQQHAASRSVATAE